MVPPLCRDTFVIEWSAPSVSHRSPWKTGRAAARSRARLPTPPRAAPGGVLELRVLDRADACLEGVRLWLTRRQLEIVALLGLHRDGLSLDALHAHLYGDRPVSPVTLKA